MKKLTLAICCLALSGASVNSLSFKNNSGSAAAAHVVLNTNPASNEIRFYKDGTKHYKLPKFDKIYWTIAGSKKEINCSLEEIELTTQETLILNKTDNEYSCTKYP